MMGNKINQISPVNQINQITNAGTLKLQQASTQLQVQTNASAGIKTGAAKSSFADLLQQEVDRSQNVQFSRHAAQRVQERGIEMTENLLQDLNQAISKAREKGAKDVVVIGQQGAFIVNIPNNVVVTTMTSQEMKQNIFTNIDSAVLL